MKSTDEEDEEEEDEEEDEKDAPEREPISSVELLENDLDSPEESAVVEEVEDSILLQQPNEILTAVIKWAVFFDINSLVELALTCKTLYGFVFDQPIWTFLSSKANDSQSASFLKNQLKFYNNDWYNFWLDYPRIRKDGLYISRIQYIRTGLSEVMTYVQPTHVVVYYRYIRFYPGQTFLICKTTDEPSKVVHRFDYGSKLKGVIEGRWVWLQNGVLRLEWKDPKQPQYMFRALMRLAFTVRGRNDRLQWVEYSSYHINNPETISSFPKDVHLKTFRFSRVRSYTPQ
ncbi:hypothetical protein BC833DRAFT_572651 [Globomyces pollinis-pini]|nr:hypothetical protein BC833DRAFT_572651 [Globomyces pollinis-pini]